MMTRLLLLGLSLTSGAAFCDEWNVESASTPVFSQPSAEGPPVGHLPKGTRIDVIEEENGFFRLRSRAGRTLWVNRAHVQKLVEKTQYDVTEDVKPAFPGREPDFKRVRLDLGASGGRASNESFIEGALGVEYFMMERLSWRNALYYRRPQVAPDSVGLDTSLRANGRLPLGALGLRGIIGAGYRFSSVGENAPLVEVGGLAALRGFEVGLMVRGLLNSVSDSSRENVVTYSVVFSGSAGFF